MLAKEEATMKDVMVRNDGERAKRRHYGHIIIEYVTVS
jgi:phage baseplate assembly protein W